MLAALGPRWPGVKNGLILAGVQMPPLSLPLMVVQLATRFAFRARPTRHLPVLQVYVYFALAQLEFHSFHKPGRLDPQNLPVQFTILHPPIFAFQSSSPTTKPEFPFLMRCDCARALPTRMSC